MSTALPTGEKGPAEGGTAQSGRLADDRTVADCAASLVQRVAKNGKEADWCNDTFEHEEVLDLSTVSLGDEAERVGCRAIPWCKVCTGRESEARSKAGRQSFLL